LSYSARQLADFYHRVMESSYSEVRDVQSVVDRRQGFSLSSMYPSFRENPLRIPELTWLLESISKMWIRVQGKAQIDSKAEHTWRYVSILNRFATPHWALSPPEAD